MMGLCSGLYSSSKYSLFGSRRTVITEHLLQGMIARDFLVPILSLFEYQALPRSSVSYLSTLPTVPSYAPSSGHHLVITIISSLQPFQL
jgi:hypothetical protein